MNTISWQSPSNIALIKYWGKKHNQLPMNPSISFTLSKAVSETKIVWKENKTDTIAVDFLFEKKKNTAFETRLVKYINSVTTILPALKGLHLSIESKNSFPHSSGIASSASAMSALALCLASIEKQTNDRFNNKNEFYQTVSQLARLGSGSAARSIYGGVNLWGNIPDIENSSNEYSIDISSKVHPDFLQYGDAVLLVSTKEKKVSSSVGHGLMNNHPYAKVKFKESYCNTQLMLDILKQGDREKFAVLVEAEALALHAMMLTSSPSYLLMEPNTIAILNNIRNFRETSGIQVCFTLDAGANVHLLYPLNEKAKVHYFIKEILEPFCNKGVWIDDQVGKGPIMKEQNEF